MISIAIIRNNHRCIAPLGVVKLAYIIELYLLPHCSQYKPCLDRARAILSATLTGAGAEH